MFLMFLTLFIQMPPANAEDVCPLLIGQPLPTLELNDSNGNPFDVNKAVGEGTTVLIFYRGSWCPFCNRHLGQLQEVLPKLEAFGAQLFAISPDRPDIVETPAEKQDLGYRLLSDSSMQAAKAMGIAFKLDDATVTKYKSSYKIDIEADSGQTHHLLPVPAVFVIDRNGTIQFSYVNPNYKERLEPEILLAVVKSLSGD